MMLRQVEIGQAYPVIYRPARLPSAAPSMVFEASGSTSTVNLTAVASSFAVKVSGYHTLAAPDGGPALDPSSLRGVTGESAGAAVLDLGAEGTYPVRIMGVTSTVVRLDDQCPDLPVNATGTLHPNVYSGTLASGAVGAAVDRAGRWYVRYTTDDGDDAPGEAVTDAGPLRVVRFRFDTGLSDAGLRRDPRLPSQIARGSNSWHEMIRSTLPTLIADIEQVLSGSARGYADRTLGAQWQFAHGLLVVAELVEAGKLSDPANVQTIGLDEPNTARNRYLRELRRTAARVQWTDADDDGEIDEGEESSAAAFDPAAIFYSTGKARGEAIAAVTVTQLTLDTDDR